MHLTVGGCHVLNHYASHPIGIWLANRFYPEKIFSEICPRLKKPSTALQNSVIDSIL